MDVTEVLEKARDAITVSRVYGEPYEKDGLTVIPAARVSGGGGGGAGKDEKGGDGSGGGFGISGKPAGAYVIRHGDVTWRPAVDPEPDRRRGRPGPHRLAGQPPAGDPGAGEGQPLGRRRARPLIVVRPGNQ